MVNETKLTSRSLTTVKPSNESISRTEKAGRKSLVARLSAIGVVACLLCLVGPLLAVMSAIALGTALGFRLIVGIALASAAWLRLR